MGRVLLVHPDNTAWNDPERAEPIEPLMRFGSDKNDSALLTQPQILKRDDERLHLLLEFRTALPSWNRLPMDTSRRMSEEGTDALRHARAQDDVLNMLKDETMVSLSNHEL